MRACAIRSGQLLDKAGLARDVGISSKAASDWLSVLTASNQVQLLEPYFENVGQRLVKSPKLYLSDTGLLCFLLGLDEKNLRRSSHLGAVWETAVYAQLRKHLGRVRGRDSLWFYRDGQQREVDFLISQGPVRRLVEVKWSENPDAHDAKTLREVAAIMRVGGAHSEVDTTIVCRTPHASALADGTKVIEVRDIPGALGWPAV